MHRPPYCLPIDVLRLFDPTLEQSDVRDENLLAAGDVEKFRAEIEDFSSEFDTRTRNPQRLTSIGRRGDRYEHHDATQDKYQGGVKVWLDHRNVLPLDPDEGDELRVRTGRNNYRDLTAQSESYRLNAEKGVIQIFRRARGGDIRYHRALRDDFVQVRYRYGAYGGSRNDPGQTELSADAGTDGALSFEHPERLPASGVVQVGGFGGEYVRYGGIDDDAGEPLSAERGVRGTSRADLSSGDPVHYCPLDVRRAVAGIVAAQFVRSDDYADNLPTPDDNVDHGGKIEDWEEEWDRTLGQYSEAKSL